MLSTPRVCIGPPVWLVRQALTQMAGRSSSSSAMSNDSVGDAMFKNVAHFPEQLRVKAMLTAKAEKGHIQAYNAYAARDPRVPEGTLPGLEGTQFVRFFTNTYKRNWELAPMWACMALWAVLFGATIYGSFSKWEIWLDRSKKLPPFDWERDRDVYYKHHSVFWPNVHGTNVYHRRLVDMEQLQVCNCPIVVHHIPLRAQDELIVAAKERGTR